MSRLLILLCMVGWALYTVHTNSNKSGDFVAQESRGFAAQSPARKQQRQQNPNFNPLLPLQRNLPTQDSVPASL